MRCTNFAGTGGKQLARRNGGRDSEAGEVSAGREERGNVPEDDIEVDRETLEALDAEDMMGREASDAGRPPVGENTERCMHRRARAWWFDLHLVQTGGAVCLNAQLQEGALTIASD